MAKEPGSLYPNHKDAAVRLVEHITHDDVGSWNAERLDAIDLDIRLQAHN
jgi:hypothetical protein